MSISNYAIVESGQIGRNVTISEFAIVRAGAVLGNDIVIHPHVVIEAGVVLHDGVEVFPGAYIGKEPKGAGALARPLSFERRVVIGAHSSISPHAVIYYDVEIGEHTLIGDGVSIREQCRIGSRCVISRYVTVNYNSKVGDRTKVMDLSHITGNCQIGNDVFISAGVIMTNDNSIGRDSYNEETMRGPIIEDEVMIGSGAQLLPNILIGRGAIIGAGSVVTKNVASHTLAMGVPARFVRSTLDNK